MKKLFKGLFVFCAAMLPLSVNLSATYYEMGVNQTRYSTEFHAVNGYAYGRLTNYNQNIAGAANASGDGTVILQSNTLGINQCEQQGVNKEYKEYIQCDAYGLGSGYYVSKGHWSAIRHDSTIWSEIS